MYAPAGAACQLILAQAMAEGDPREEMTGQAVPSEGGRPASK